MIKIIRKAIVILEILFFSIFIIFGSAGVNIIHASAAGDANDKGVLYLSDTTRIKHDASKTKADRNKLVFNQNDAGAKIQVKIEGSWYTFEKGIYAHGPSYVAYNISEFSQEYKYFSAYGGLLPTATKSDGALFYVQTSEDGNKWVTQSPSDTSVSTDNLGRQLVKYNQNALYFTLDVTGVKWIRLVADKNGSNAQDYVVWADAKLSTTLDSGESVQSLAAYDEKIKAKVSKGANLDDKELELLVLQREFVSRVGQYALKKFTTQSGDSNADNKAVLDWLFNDLDNLREFMLGGTPFKDSYYNSLTVLSNLYKHYKADLDDTRLLKNKWYPNRTYGELYRTMMFSVALTHDGAIGSYLQGSKEENKSDPLRRYAIFRYMYETERFVATRNADGSWKSETMNLFGSLRVEEMRWLMCNIIDDESILWLNDYVQTRINANPNNVGNLYTPHSYVKYVDPNYNNPVFYAEENRDYFNDLFAVDGRDDKKGQKIGLWDLEYKIPGWDDEEGHTYTIKITRGTTDNKIQKVWMNFKNKFGTGSVCGGISKSGTNIRTSRGIPANVIGQPGHAAILYYSKDANGHGSWKIDNDVGGWLAATKGERHLLGWGNADWQRNSGGTVVYFHLAQTCLDDYDNLVRAEEYTWLAKVYQDDLDMQEKLYEKALATQILNLDAWYGLVKTYKASTKKTAANFGNLANRIANTLWNHPVAMHCLFRLFTDTEKTKIPEVEAALTDPLFTTQLKTIEVNALAKAKASGSTAAKSKVSYLLGLTDTSVADFSFDGENAGCIVWAEAYNDGSFTWKYSLDGKKTWKEVTFNEGESHAYLLSEEDLASISTDDDIYVYIVGASPDNAYRIDVAAKPTMPDTLYANDWENRVIGVDATYEWRYCTSTKTANETDTEVKYTPTTGWISYAEASPDCSGDRIIEVRLKGTAKKPASDGRIFIFTPDTDTEDRKYISVSYLSVVEFSTESQDAKRPNYAANAIDGNAKTYWHTDYAISIKNTVVDKDGNSKPYEPAYLTIKIDLPRYISGLEFVQYQYNASFSIFAKNVTVYVSEDGENWQKAATREGFEEIDDLKVVHFAESIYGQYVKLEMTALYETNAKDGVFTTVSLVNLYEDTTKSQSPTGEDMPSLSEVKPSGSTFEGLGEIISEEEALIIGDKKDSPKSNTGLWIALSVVGSILIAAAVVFLLYKFKIIKFKGKKNQDKGSEPKASAPETKTSTAKPKASTAESKASTAKPKASTTETKTSTAKPKASTTESKASTAKPKASAPESKASTAKPKASAPESKASTAKPKASTAESKASTTKSKTTTASKSNAAKPKNK